MFYVMAFVVLILVVLIGVYYFRIHMLPSELVRGSKVQHGLVSVLMLISLFSRNHLYWVAALLLALVPFPNFGAPFVDMAASLEKLARAPRRSEAVNTSTSPRVQPHSEMQEPRRAANDK